MTNRQDAMRTRATAAKYVTATLRSWQIAGVCVLICSLVCIARQKSLTVNHLFNTMIENQEQTDDEVIWTDR